MSHKLKDRIYSYHDACDYKLLNKLPLIICINGRAFSRFTSLLNKPYDTEFADLMNSVAYNLCIEIEGAIFSYQYNDEIVIIARNDQSIDTESWYDNKLQKICSIVSSMATNDFKNASNQTNLNLVGDPIFATQVFTVPNISEAINTIIFKQQQSFHTSIQFACYYELLKKYDKNSIKEMLSGLTVDDKIFLLSNECNVDFNEYSNSFRRGTSCYKVPKITNNGTVKNKWILNKELPIFTKDQSFLSNIFKNGVDIFRKESL